MKALTNFNLAKLNTFAIPAKADYYCPIHNTQDLITALGHPQLQRLPRFILGGGSNILFTQDFAGVVLHPCEQGIQVTQHDSHALVSAKAGENWHRLVCYCIKHGYHGIENLSLIPGSVGAAAIQNIGAYGVELKDVFHSLIAIDLNSLEPRVFTLDDCDFGYRNSIFKQSLKNQYCITELTLKLHYQTQCNLSYPALAQYLTQQAIQPTPQRVAQAVCAIRRSKLPDPTRLPNAGSFFKNPIVSSEQARAIQRDHADLPQYPRPNNQVKIPAAWLIEQCGYKGKRVGDAGVHQHQAVVLVNHHQAQGYDILSLAQDIQRAVKTQFAIELEPEVQAL